MHERTDSSPSERQFTVFRADGWPLCPACGEDELYSLANPATTETVSGCYRCPWKPATDATKRRKLWRVDLNDVHVHDEAGHDYPVTLTRGQLDGPLTVSVVSQDVPLAVAEGLAAALEAFYQPAHPHSTERFIHARRVLDEFRAAYPAKRGAS